MSEQFVNKFPINRASCAARAFLSDEFAGYDLHYSSILWENPARLKNYSYIVHRFLTHSITVNTAFPGVENGTNL